MFAEIEKEVKLANTQTDGKRKLLLIIYYAGHGVIKSTTEIMMNETDCKKRFFPLERKLNLLSCYKNNYITAIFDCCRETMPEVDGPVGGSREH